MATISFIICTSAKRAYNHRRIPAHKTQDLKPFKIRTYKKTGGGPGGGPLGRPPPYRLRSLLETPPPFGASLSMYVQERPGGPGTQVLTMRRFLIAFASLAVLPAIVFAQGRGMMSGMARPAMAAPAPHVAMRAAPSVGTRVSPGGQAVSAYPRYV
jgi:hypothetical protein